MKEMAGIAGMAEPAGSSPLAGALTSGAMQMAEAASPVVGKIAPTASAVMQALAAGGNPAQIAASMAAPAVGMLNPLAGQLASGAMSGMGSALASPSPMVAAAPPDDHPLSGQPLSDLASAPQFFVPGQTPSAPAAAASTSPFSETTRLLRFQSSLTGNRALSIAAIKGGEALSEMPSYTLDLITQNPSIDLKDVLNQAVAVNITLQDGSERQIHGYLVRFGFERNDGGIAHYRGDLVPWLWYLGKRVNSRIYQQVTVLDVLRKVFADYGALVDYQTHIKQELKPEDYVVQFQESDLNFVSRLLERHGLFYYFEYRQDGHTLVIADDSASCPAQAHDPVVTYNAASGVQQADRLTALSASRETQPGVVALHTFDYKHPKSRPYVELPTLADQGNAPKLEVYDGNSAFAYKDASAGEAEAKRRLEVFEWQAKVFHGESGCRGLTVGRKFRIDGHFWFDPAKQDDNEFLVIGIEIDAKNNFDDASAQPGSFRNALTLIRSKIPYRPERLHEKPIMPGPQSAIVVGPKGQEIHTDGMGRIKVQFPWDRYGKNDQESSCWIRVSQPWAGRGWGTVAIPRVNQEVIVDFLNGDPDRPIVVGRMFNAEQTPPYALPDGAHQMGFHSNSTPGGGGFCEVVIHDKKGDELVNIHSQKDMATTVQNNHVTVVNGPNQTNVVTQGQHANIVRKAISVQSQDAHIQHTAKTAVILHAQEQHMALKAKGPVQIESDTEHVHVKGSQSIVLECGKAKITLSADGQIVIDGTRVVVLGSQSVDLNPDGASGPASPPLVPVTDPSAPEPDLAAPAGGGGGGGGGAAAAAPGHGKKPAKAAQKKAVTTGLGARVDQLAAKSPTLERDITKLQKDGWHIQYGPANQGSSTNKHGQPPTIVIDGNDRGNPEAVVQGLAHETGHALYRGTPDYSTKTNYVNSELADEGAATLNNIKVQREILSHGGSDISIAGNPDNAPAYNAAYDRFLQNGDVSAARAAIGHVYGTGEYASVPVNGQYVNYQTYYGSWYDRNYPSH
ncbi:type VI secretion system tip protein VgrG [Burkholderia ambifaria]|uniref:Type VI secretion system tip protein VgrG n=1 Tax=Burkholderia ambifaria TaxID=152480 RepID=A0AA41E7E0_9BURK|nr:type VI secretion system tip protein TssI/VgrG [Burkholderia ambifaria]MBR8129809.1 type VI secretion system tip protein VgrG [Burkholderia ambifaria]UEP50828.1 type VI secretion system tip protein VgrG [Burkholderia ambifaria]